MKKFWRLILGISGIVGIYLLYMELTKGRAWQWYFAAYPVGALLIVSAIAIAIAHDNSAKLNLSHCSFVPVIFFFFLITSIAVTICSVMLFFGKESVTKNILKINGYLSPGQNIAVHITPEIKSISGYYDFHGSLDLYSDTESKLASHKLDIDEGFSSGDAPKKIIGGLGTSIHEKCIHFGTTIKLPSNLSEQGQRILLTLEGHLTYLSSVGNRTYTSRTQEIRESIYINVMQKGYRGVTGTSTMLIMLPIMSALFSAIAICLNLILSNARDRKEKA